MEGQFRFGEGGRGSHGRGRGGYGRGGYGRGGYGRGGYGRGSEEHHGNRGGSWRGGRDRGGRGGMDRRGRDWDRGRRDRDDEPARSTSGERERPPPGLRGREIGMWFARKSQARKEQQQIENRPTVSMGKDKEENIRHLLDNLGRREGGNCASNQGDSDSNNPQASAFKEPGSFDVKKERTSSLEALNPPKHARKESAKQEVTYDSWEDRFTSDGVKDKPVVAQASSSVGVLPPSSLSGQDTEAVIDLDEYDGDGNSLPSVTGVMEYMSAHSDYPYQTGVDKDFEPVVERVGNPRLDQEMLKRIESLQSDPDFCKMLEFRQKLPSYKMRDQVVDTIKDAQVVVISGETGCGKTTQVPQFILDDYIQRGIGSQCSIICTQPRRISAISVAERVAAERCERVDATGHNSIGYQIRLETKRPRTQGSILFCTTGIVLKFLEGDPKLERATHVIIDEIHERDLQSDFLMIILKDLLMVRADLKVILMSATLNAEMFSKYFNNCPMLNIPGFTFPVKEYCLEEILEMTNFICDDSNRRPPRRKPRHMMKPEEVEMEEMYHVWCNNQVGEFSPPVVNMLRNLDHSETNVDLMLHIIQYIMTHMGDGAILVFVPGWVEIKKLNDMIQQAFRSQSGMLRVIPLHSLMPTVNQREVFDRPPPGVRKIVIATNIAETSITIDDVVFVIDCGKIKVKGFQPDMNLTSLEAQWVSKANAKQRTGRAGRVQAGHCFHLYTSFHHQMAQDYLPPEMLRTRLEELCLQIKLLKLGRIVPFISKAMQHPSMEAIQHAIETLTELSALDQNEELLPLGYHLARMPVEPHTAKMILFGAMFGILDPILTVAASLSFKDAFVIPLGKEDAADKARKALAKGTKSDHLMLINAFQGWEEIKDRSGSDSYCWSNFLSQNTLQLLKDMKRQLAELLYDTGFIETKNPKDPKANVNKGNQSMLRAILCAGLYPNVAQVTRVPKTSKSRNQTVQMILKDRSKVCAHPKSVNMAETFFESKWMVFYIKLKTSKIYIHDSTMVSPFPLLFFGGNIGIKKDNSQEVVTVDDWMIFKASHSTARLVKELRVELDEVLRRKITNPGPTLWDQESKEGAIMRAIADLITTEQLGSGQKNDGSIGNPYAEDNTRDDWW